LKTATTLPQEIKWLNREMNRVLAQSTPSAETPIRIHSRDTDAGGAPEWHTSFERWIDAKRDMTKRQDRFYESDQKTHPQRLKRSLRQLRRLAPREYDAIYLMVALGYTWHRAMSKINDDNLTRGKAEYTEGEFLILTVSGSSLLLAGF
jgi:hypothetical protein